MKYETETDKMKAMITAYVRLEQVSRGMDPLFGGLCGCGYLQEARDILFNLIEKSAVFPSDITDEDEKAFYLFETLEAKISVSNKTKLLGH